MRALPLAAPAWQGSHWQASDRRGAVEVRFLGHGPASERSAALQAAGGNGLELGWCRQVHGDRAVSATAGDCGEGDALLTRRTGLALCVVTADCVPVVIGDSERLAVVHAGWRGIAAEIVPKTIARLGEPSTLAAWLGPAIGPCCYEVGHEVADSVRQATGPRAVVDQQGPRPHLDLHAAVLEQLEAAAVSEVAQVGACTHCRPEALWSYRREGRGAGRNWTFAWLGKPRAESGSGSG